MPKSRLVFLTFLSLGLACSRSGFEPSQPGGDDAGSEKCLSWTRKRLIQVKGSAHDLTDFQVRARIDFDSDLRPDYADLRFLDEQGTLLEHWLEEVGPRYAVVWIKVPSIPTAGTTVTMVYGNPCANSASSFGGTFPWKTEFVDTIRVQHTSIAVDSNNSPHISYFDRDKTRLKYAKWNGGAWEIEVVEDSGNTGAHTCIILDARSLPHIAFYDRGNSHVEYARFDGASWITQIVETCTADNGADPSLTLDSNSLPRMSYYRGGTRELKYARSNGAAWQTEIVDPAKTETTALVLDADQNPHIAYTRDVAGLGYARWDGDSWEREDLDANGTYVALALDSTYRPHIAYYDTGNALKYAWNDGTTWRRETVKLIGAVSHFVGMYLDRRDRPHICFQDNQLVGTLAYAERNGSLWSIEQVDTAGSTGHDPAIAPDTYGFPQISYFSDSGDIGLKHAYRRAHAFPEPTVEVGEELIVGR